MTTSDLSRLDLMDVVAVLRQRKATAVEVLDATLSNIERFDPHLHAYIHVLEGAARAQAAESDAALRRGGPLGLLCGVPVSVKDNIAVKGTATTAGSPILLDSVAPEDAGVTRRLRAHRAVLVAKCNMHELAFAAPNHLFGSVRNPWAPDLTVGGSSSGSACAVSACMCAASIGTDTGGSIRIPASFCAVVGLKPTFGVVDRSGVISVSMSLDHVGPLARTVRDVTLVFLATHDSTPNDGMDAAQRYLAEVESGVRGLKLGYAPAEVLDPLDSTVADAYEEVLAGLAAEGVILHTVHLPPLDLARSVFRVIATAELAEQERQRFARRKHEYGHELQDFLDDGETIPAIDYIRALRIRTLLTTRLLEAMRGLDAIVLPTVPVPPYPEGQATTRINGIPQDSIKVMTQYTTLFNLTGCPALSVPAVLSDDRFPIGIQVASQPGNDQMVLRVGRAWERLAEPGLNTTPTLLRESLPNLARATDRKIREPAEK